MCGIYGMVSLDGHPLPDAAAAADRMAPTLAHRGPDAHHRLTCPAGFIGAHRLRVRDLSPAADMPFRTADDRLWLVANGEIYNSHLLRARHPDYPWRSGSDLEPILPLYLERGPAGLADLDGMFAVALWDRQAGRLTVARDRAGEKPLFLRRLGNAIAFASELETLLTLPGGRRLAADAVADFAMLGFVREPRTLFADVTRQPSGTITVITSATASHVRYWTAAHGDPPTVSDLRGVLDAAVERQLVADVPVGVFASGGLDSSILAARAVAHRGRSAITTFSVGFPEASYDERPHARRLADWLGTRHVEVTADRAALADARLTTRRVAEPVSDPAFLPTILLARAARRHVTVVLSGEGADELFGGYPTYPGHRAAALWRRLPAGVCAGLTRAAQALPASGERVPLEFLLKRFTAAAALPWLPRHLAWYGPGLARDCLAVPWAWAPPADTAAPDAVEGAMRFDYTHGLRERLLVKIDRATMLSALEARAPFLDPAVTRAARSIAGQRHVAFRGKRVLREVARDWLPPYILQRVKRGLSVPVGQWLCQDLAGEADRLLAPDRLHAQGLFRPGAVTRLWSEHRTGRADHGRALWTLFTFQDWMDHWGPEACG